MARLVTVWDLAAGRRLVPAAYGGFKRRLGPQITRNPAAQVPRSLRLPAAADFQNRARYVVRLFREQPDHRLGDFLSRAGSAHRDRRLQPL